jgi:hypothetical protein
LIRILRAGGQETDLIADGAERRVQPLVADLLNLDFLRNPPFGLGFALETRRKRRGVGAISINSMEVRIDF